MKLTDAVASFLDQRRSHLRAAETIEQYRYMLEGLWLPWRAQRGLPDELDSLSQAELDAYFDYLAYEHVNRRTGARGLGHETINSSWRTLRALWRYAVAQSWPQKPQRISFQRGGVQLPRATPPPAPANDAALLALLAVCDEIDNPEERTRNVAIIRLLEAGLRISEIVAMRDEQLDLRERRAHVTLSGGRQVWVCWGYHAARALRTYVQSRGGALGGPVFRNLHPPAVGQGLTSSSLRRMVQRISQRAGVTWQPGNPPPPRCRNR